MAAVSQVVIAVADLKPNRRILAHVKAVIAERDKVAAGEVLDNTYLDYVRSGMGRATAARQMEWDPFQVFKRIKIDADFALRIQVAEAESMEPVAKMVRDQALAGEKWAAIKLLESKSAEEYGPQDKNININVKTELVGDALILERINNLGRQLAEKLQMQELTEGYIDIPDEDIEEM